MMKPRHALLTLLSLLSVSLAIPPKANAQITGDRADYRALHRALCSYDVRNSLSAVQELLNSPQDSAEEAWNLINLRSRLYDHRDGLSPFPPAATNCEIYASGDLYTSAFLPVSFTFVQGNAQTHIGFSSYDSLNWQRSIELMQAGAGQSGDTNSPYTFMDYELTSGWGSGGGGGGVSSSSSSSSGGGSSGRGRCDNPDDLASDGSRCGGRAASIRLGGR